MEDSYIVDLYWQRSEAAIEKTAAKYGKYCFSIAYNILGDRADAEEIVNDTYMGAWNSMPENRPAVLSAYLGKITRRLSIKAWRKGLAAKRGGGQTLLALEELSECVPSGHSVENELETALLAQVIDGFIASLPDMERRVFLCRYWYLDPISDISRRFGFSQSKVKTTLYRTRQKLLAHLKKEGIYDDC